MGNEVYDAKIINNASIQELKIKEEIDQTNSENLRKMRSEQLLGQKQVVDVILRVFQKQAIQENPRDFTVFNVADTAMQDVGTVSNVVLDTTSKIKDHYKDYMIKEEDGDFNAEAKASRLLGESLSSSRTKSNTKQDEELEVEKEIVSEDNPEPTLAGPKPEGFRKYSPEEKERFEEILGIDTFGPNNAAGKLLRECIPCGIRTLGPSEFGMRFELINPLEEAAERMKELADMLSNLAMNNEAMDDFCNLLDMLKFQCVPDLFGIISLLTMLELKYSNLLDISIDGLLSTLLGSLLGPILGQITGTLDQYIDLIMDPIECVLESLENQLAKLDVSSALDKSQQIKRQYENRRNSFYKKKLAALKARHDKLEKDIKAGNTYPTVQDRYGSLGDVYDNSKAKIQKTVSNSINKFDKYSQNSKTGKRDTDKIPLTKRGLVSTPVKRDEITRSNAQNDAADVARMIVPNAVSAKEEQRNIEAEMTKIMAKRMPELNDPNYRKDTLYKGGEAIRGGRRSLDKASLAVRETKDSLKNSINILVEGILEGKDVINTMFETMKDELLRTVLGRVETQEDQIQLALSIEKFTRLISIANALIKLGSDGTSSLCNNKDAAGSFVGQLRKETANDRFNFYAATDSEGNDLLIATPGGTKVTVTGFQEDQSQQDLLFEDSLISEESAQSVDIYNELDEANTANQNGVLPDLGNISGKNIELEFINKDDTSELNVEDNYVIMVNNFCSKSSLNFGSSESVTEWASKL